MKQIKQLKKGYLKLIGDKRTNVWHISIYMALLYLWAKNDGTNPITITRKQVMKLAHVSSNATYHKCIKQWQKFGYINYVPSYNYFLGSQVFLLSVTD